MHSAFTQLARVERVAGNEFLRVVGHGYCAAVKECADLDFVVNYWKPYATAARVSVVDLARLKLASYPGPSWEGPGYDASLKYAACITL